MRLKCFKYTIYIVLFLNFHFANFFLLNVNEVLKTTSYLPYIRVYKLYYIGIN